MSGHWPSALDNYAVCHTFFAMTILIYVNFFNYYFVILLRFLYRKWPKVMEFSLDEMNDVFFTYYLASSGADGNLKVIKRTNGPIMRLYSPSLHSIHNYFISQGTFFFPVISVKRG